MKNIFAFIIVVAASLPTPGLQAAAGDWIKFTSDAGRFSVLMPGPEAPKDDAATKTDPKLGPYTTHLFLQKSDKGLFLAGWVDYAPSVRLDIPGELAASLAGRPSVSLLAGDLTPAFLFLTGILSTGFGQTD